jgi:uncharacterized protein (DUF302 family)
MKNKYGFGKIVTYPFLEAIERVKKELEKEGFGILTEIDVSETLQKKLNQQMPPYCILGACNPQIAHRALEIDASIGLLLPCNVVIRQGSNQKVYVEFMDPKAILELVNEPKIGLIAKEASERLERVKEAL